MPTVTTRIPALSDTVTQVVTDRLRPGALTLDQRLAIRHQLVELAELEEDRVECVATIGAETLAAYDVGVRDAVRDALAKLASGTYGNCETCHRPIPAARLEAVPSRGGALPVLPGAHGGRLGSGPWAGRERCAHSGWRTAGPVRDAVVDELDVADLWSAERSRRGRRHRCFAARGGGPATIRRRGLPPSPPRCRARPARPLGALSTIWRETLRIVLVSLPYPRLGELRPVDVHPGGPAIVGARDRRRRRCRLPSPVAALVGFALAWRRWGLPPTIMRGRRQRPAMSSSSPAAQNQRRQSMPPRRETLSPSAGRGGRGRGGR